jgi:hypothetical protein
LKWLSYEVKDIPDAKSDATCLLMINGQEILHSSELREFFTLLN